MTTCRQCGKEGARNGKQPNKYCNDAECMRVGVQAGHIRSQDKRPRTASPTSSELTAVSESVAGELMSIERIYGCRYLPCIPPLALRACTFLQMTFCFARCARGVHAGTVT